MYGVFDRYQKSQAVIWLSEKLVYKCKYLASEQLFPSTEHLEYSIPGAQST